MGFIAPIDCNCLGCSRVAALSHCVCVMLTKSMCKRGYFCFASVEEAIPEGEV